MKINHYPSCKASYPEKPNNEKPREIQEIDIGDSIIKQCVDCGAFVEVRKDKEQK